MHYNVCNHVTYIYVHTWVMSINHTPLPWPTYYVWYTSNCYLYARLLPSCWLYHHHHHRHHHQYQGNRLLGGSFHPKNCGLNPIFPTSTIPVRTKECWVLKACFFLHQSKTDKCQYWVYSKIWRCTLHYIALSWSSCRVSIEKPAHTNLGGARLLPLSVQGSEALLLNRCMWGHQICKLLRRCSVLSTICRGFSFARVFFVCWSYFQRLL